MLAGQETLVFFSVLAEEEIFVFSLPARDEITEITAVSSIPSERKIPTTPSSPTLRSPWAPSSAWPRAEPARHGLLARQGRGISRG